MFREGIIGKYYKALSILESGLDDEVFCLGSACKEHPLLKGLRYKSNRSCPICKRKGTKLSKFGRKNKGAIFDNSIEKELNDQINEVWDV